MGFRLLSLASIVVVLFWMGFFFLSSLPLMILKHDTPMDARFIRGLFFWYYSVLVVAATAGTLAQLLASNYPLAATLAVLLAIVLVARSKVLARMDALRAVMPDEEGSIARFRRLHVAGMALNVVQIAVVATCLIRFA